MLKILGGYGIILGYVTALIFLLGPVLNRKAGQETSRKVIHILLFAVWCLIDLFLRGTIHQVIIPVIFLILNSLSYKFKLYKSVERQEDNHPGTIYFAIVITAILGIAWVFPRWYAASGIATFCLTFGDGFAALVGYHTRSRRIRSHKTGNGTAACALASAVSLGIFAWAYGLALSPVQILAIALLAAFLELAERGLDNFTVVAGTFVLSYGFLEAPSPALLGSILVAEAVFAVVFFSGAIDYWGSMLALGLVFAFGYFGGGFALGYLLVAYFTVFAVALVKKRLTGSGKGEGRGFLQILINGGAGLTFVLLEGLSPLESCLEIGLICIGGCFVDSLSSDIGVLSTGRAWDILKWKPVEAGLSGGVSLLGTLAAFLAAGLLAAALGLYAGLEAWKTLAAFGLMFGQSLLDSILGSALQAKYRCSLCGSITDHATHCGSPAIHTAGMVWMRNNLVNLLSSLVIAVLACGILLG